MAEALREIESFACHQCGRGSNKRYVTSGKIAAAVFRHGARRALDPNVHSRVSVFNAVRDHSGTILLALKSSNTPQPRTPLKVAARTYRLARLEPPTVHAQARFDCSGDGVRAPRVTVTGDMLEIVYAAIAENEARVIRVLAAEFASDAWPPVYQALVRGIRIELLQDIRKKTK